MLARLLLVILQIVAAWFGADFLVKFVPAGEYELFVFAAIAAAIVYVLGLLASLILGDVSQPGVGTLAFTIVFALLGAALAIWGPGYFPSIPWSSAPATYLAVGGAILGYIMLK